MPALLPGRALPPFTDDDEPFVLGVTSDYLRAVGARLVRGRWVRDDDRAETAPVIVLSDIAVRRYFGDRDALGEVLRLGDQPRLIVGVVQGIRHNGPERQVRPEVYVPFLQDTQPSASIVARVRRAPAGAVRIVEDAVRAAAPTATLYSPQTLDQHFARLIAPRQFNMLVIGTFGVLAVVIAGLGVYGLIAFMVGQRTRELGVRLALGAPPGDLLRLVLIRAGKWVAAGLIVGLVAAAWLERFARAFLFDARPYDPVIYGSVVVVLAAAGLLAALGPARRAARVDPLLALRSE
jgi:putative ABC transport system permease protein